MDAVASFRSDSSCPSVSILMNVTSSWQPHCRESSSVTASRLQVVEVEAGKGTT